MNKKAQREIAKALREGATSSGVTAEDAAVITAYVADAMQANMPTGTTFDREVFVALARPE